ncbi:hypothetical protein F4826_004788 [Rahnella inusitata]|nr:hypothetical protein [Rahnella inusitata]
MNTKVFLLIIVILVVLIINYLNLRKIRRVRERITNERLALEQERKLSLQNLKEKIIVPYGVSEEWFKNAWPLWQISFIVDVPPGSLSHEIPLILRCRAARNFKKGTYTAGNPDSELNSWSWLSRMTAYEQSFFGTQSGCGIDLAPDVFAREFVHSLFAGCRWHGLNDRVYILLQGIKNTPSETLQEFLFEISAKIEQGISEGCEHDDDSGWAFRVAPAITDADSECGYMINRTINTRQFANVSCVIK